MNRRAIVGALAVGLTGCHDMLGYFSSVYAQDSPTVYGPVGINLDIGDVEGFPLFKNQLRTSRGFTYASPPPQQAVGCPLSAAGWPTVDFTMILFEGITVSPAPSWITAGAFACGFLTTTGTETITGYTSTVSNISRGSIGTYTTFDLTYIPGNPVLGFVITGTSGTTANVFAFLPVYRSLAPASGTSGAIDDPTTSNAFTNEAILHYSQFAHVRFMGATLATYNCQVSTSSTRRTPSNTQALSPAPAPSSSIAFTSAPGNGATSATLTANWPFPSGSYGLPIRTNNNLGGRICTLTNGATTCTWANALTEASNNANLVVNVSAEGYFPIEWIVAFCNACNIGIWINTPMLEDGTNSSAGTWASTVMDYLVAHWKSSGTIYFEMSNEVWNFNYTASNLLNGISLVDGFSTPSLHPAAYIAYRLHAFAVLCRTKFPSTFGTKVKQVFAWQTVGLSDSAAILTALAALGTVSADIQEFATAPYVTPTIGNSDSIATIESTTSTAGAIQAFNSLSENNAVLATNYGIKLCTYEAGGQWGQVNQNNANVGLAIMDSGMTASLKTYYQAVLDSGASFVTHLAAGVSVATGNTSPTYQLSNIYSSPLTSPTLSALQNFMGGVTLTRNIVSGSGSVISGVNYADNSSALVNSGGTFSLGTNIAPHVGTNGYCPYLINCEVAGTYSLTVNFTVSSGTPTTSLEVNGTVVATGVSVTTGNVVVGNVTLTKGVNYVELGQAGSQSSVTINSLTFI